MNRVFATMIAACFLSACGSGNNTPEPKPTPTATSSQVSGLNALQSMIDSDAPREVEPDFIDPARHNADAFLEWPDFDTRIREAEKTGPKRTLEEEIIYAHEIGLTAYERGFAQRIEGERGYYSVRPNVPAVIQLIDCSAAVKILVSAGDIPTHEGQVWMTKLTDEVRVHLNSAYRSGVESYAITALELYTDYTLRRLMGEASLEQGVMTIEDFRERANR